MTDADHGTFTLVGDPSGAKMTLRKRGDGYRVGFDVYVVVPDPSTTP